MDPTTPATSAAAATQSPHAPQPKRFPVRPRFVRAPRVSPRGVGAGRRARLPELALGLGLAAAGALGSVLWASRGPSQRVLVAGRALHRGETFDSSMARWATVSGDRIVAISDPAALRGRTIGMDVAAGAPLQQQMLIDLPAVDSSHVEIGVALDPGHYPPALAAGDSVTVVVLAAPDQLGNSAPAQVLDGLASVRAIANPDGATGTKTVVSLLVAQSDLRAIVGAASIRLALVGSAVASSQEPGLS